MFNINRKKKQKTKIINCYCSCVREKSETKLIILRDLTCVEKRCKMYERNFLCLFAQDVDFLAKRIVLKISSRITKQKEIKESQSELKTVKIYRQIQNWDKKELVILR